jgi:diguanylate cyclase (GGDEF)-like protein
MRVKVWHLLLVFALIAGVGVFIASNPTLVELAGAYVTTSFLPSAGFLLGTLALMYVRAARRLRAQLLETEHLARHDMLTGLPNRILFRERAAEVLRAAERHRRKVAMMLLDLDGFKEVNDTLGHGKGDELLVAVASRLRDHLRAGDVIARLGGDEFAIITEVASHDEALRAARRINGELAAPVVLDELPLHVEGSTGIAIYPDHAVDAESLLRKADVAMYGAKAAGIPVVYDSELDDYSPRRLALVHDLRLATAGHQLVVEFQPLVDLVRLDVVSFEALVRWNHPQRGRLLPGEFLPLAEQSGLVHDMTNHILREATRQAAVWNRSRDVPVGVAVNLSGRDLHEPNLGGTVAEALRDAGLRPDLLELEISENTIVADPFRTARILKDLEAIGVRLAIDDFGAGTTSLQYLRRLAVHTLKIDRTLVAALEDEDDTRSASVLRAIVKLAHDLELRVVAEGVETVAVLQQLRELGCDVIQGFLVGRPLAIPELDLSLPEELAPAAPLQLRSEHADRAEQVEPPHPLSASL